MAEKKKDMSALMDKIKPKGGKTTSTTKTTIQLSDDDKKEIERIQDVLWSKGVKVGEGTQIIRIALRLAFAEKTDEEIARICGELAETWKRGGKGG